MMSKINNTEKMMVDTKNTWNLIPKEERETSGEQKPEFNLLGTALNEL